MRRTPHVIDRLAAEAQNAQDAAERATENKAYFDSLRDDTDAKREQDAAADKQREQDAAERQRHAREAAAREHKATTDHVRHAREARERHDREAAARAAEQVEAERQRQQDAAAAVQTAADDALSAVAALVEALNASVLKAREDVAHVPQALAHFRDVKHKADEITAWVNRCLC